jgi:hypothetical protein
VSWLLRSKIADDTKTWNLMLSSPKQAAAERNYDQNWRNHDQKQKKPGKFDEFVVASDDQDDSNN